MKMFKTATMLLACVGGTVLHTHSVSKSIEDKTQELSESVARAFNMEAPKLMNDTFPEGSDKDVCPEPAIYLTYKGSGGAFIDGCYMNTTRSEPRNETTGEAANHYLYMWKHACSYTKWIPSNQFMFANIDYNNQTMTLERFGFIGMDKKCFWGSIGVLWKRPLMVEQLKPTDNQTLQIPQK